VVFVFVRWLFAPHPGPLPIGWGEGVGSGSWFGAEPAAKGFLQFGASNPIVAPGFGVLALGIQFTFFGSNEFEGGFLHGVILQECFVHDAEPLGKINFAVELGEVTRRDEIIASLTNVRADVGGESIEAILRLT